MTQFESHPGLKNRDRKRREYQKGVGSLKRSVSRAPAALVIIGLGDSAPATRITDLLVNLMQIYLKADGAMPNTLGTCCYII